MFEALTERLFTQWHTDKDLTLAYLSYTQTGPCCLVLTLITVLTRWPPLCVWASHQGLKSHSHSERTRWFTFQKSDDNWQSKKYHWIIYYWLRLCKPQMLYCTATECVPILALYLQKPWIHEKSVTKPWLLPAKASTVTAATLSSSSEPREVLPTEIWLHCCWISDCVLDTDLFNYSLSRMPSVRAPHCLSALSKRLKESRDIVLQGHA